MPRPRRSREEWHQIVQAWRASGQSGVEFARAYGLNRNTFAWWRSELSRPAPSAPLTLVSVSGLARAAEPVEIVLRKGLVVRVPHEADVAWVARLVDALEARG